MPAKSYIAPAKLNLFLHVVGKRADSFHLLESLVVFTAFGDRVTIDPHPHLALDIDGPLADALHSEPNNLVWRAARLLADAFGKPDNIRITLEKHIPIGAGLGGGSSDAATVLMALAQWWGIDPQHPNLVTIAGQLGSDVPVCLNRTLSWMAGVGEQTRPIASTFSMPVLLANPRKTLITADIFRRYGDAFSPSVAPPSDGMTSEQLLEYITPMQNDLEQAAIQLVPEIAQLVSVLQNLPGCKLARMSGSGATCFGLFTNQAALQAAHQQITHTHPQWWVQPTELL
ncbi:MAG: 4-(cytidine 5'-diphospho)-2-C-methyl-D-erythritol kinase [Rickettsiales bacterium]|nr:4-(cytidine 5'-diphospho)-2-C-methyl-D-erythritol kinase [Rickettsiales bacterium]